MIIMKKQFRDVPIWVTFSYELLVANRITWEKGHHKFWALKSFLLASFGDWH